MTTKAELRESLRPLLRDATVWPNSALDEWTRQAFAEYSQHFPRLASGSFSATATVRTYGWYAVVGAHKGIRTVEFPTGEEPPKFLRRKAETDLEFFGGEYYDLRYEGSTAEILVLGETPSGGETIAVTYLAAHAYPASDAASLTIPDEHLQTLRLFVQWQAVRALELEVEAGVKVGASVLNELGINAVRAERIYRIFLKDLVKTVAQGGYRGGWRLDSQDRIY